MSPENEDDQPDEVVPPWDSLTEQQRTAASILARGGQVNEAAEAVGVDRSTIWRWRHRGAFTAYMRELESEQHSAVMHHLRGAAMLACHVVTQAMDEDNAPSTALAVLRLYLDGQKRPPRFP